MNDNRSHNALHSTSGVAGSAKRPGIHEVHRAAVSNPSARVSAGEAVIGEMEPLLQPLLQSHGMVPVSYTTSILLPAQRRV